MGSETDNAAYQIIRFGGVELPLRYRNLVISKWARSFRYGNDYVKLIDADNYFQSYSRYIQAILMLLPTVVRLATLIDDADVVLGFSVTSGKTLHYIHVHKDARLQGIARALVSHNIESFTHLTKMALRLWPTKMPNAKFIIYSPENEE